MAIRLIQGSSPSADEERRFRRLGITVALLWQKMPEEMQAAILNQAELVSDDNDPPEERDQLKIALDTYLDRHLPSRNERTQ